MLEMPAIQEQEVTVALLDLATRAIPASAVAVATAAVLGVVMVTYVQQRVLLLEMEAIKGVVVTAAPVIRVMRDLATQAVPAVAAVLVIPGLQELHLQLLV
jgi:hypothetical protein